MIRMLLLLICLLPWYQALAMDCYLGQAGGPVEATETVDAFAIPSSTPVGEKVWESGDISIAVTCNNNTTDDRSSEDVFAWLNPYSGQQDPYYQLGVTYNGVDYDANTGTSGIDTQQCLDHAHMGQLTPEEIEQQGYTSKLCSGNASDVHTSRTFNARLRLYAKLRAAPPADYVSTLGDYILVQFDGKGGINVTPGAKNLKYHINGLDNIRILDCSVTFQISPENQVIDFGRFSAQTIANAPLEKTFSITTSKSQDDACTDGFKLTSAFYTDATLEQEDTALLIGNGLKLRILDDAKATTFNQYSEYADFTSDRLTFGKEYTAELSKVDGQSVQLGPFSTVVLFKVNYH